MNFIELKKLVEETEAFRAGDTVSFKGRHGFIKGTIASIRDRVRTGSRDLISKGFGDLVRRTIQVAEIPTDRGLYTVPLTMLTLEERGGQEVADIARAQKDQFRTEVSQMQNDRKDQTYQKSKENNLLDLNPGDKVMCKYSTGTKEREYVRSSPSGRIGVKNSRGDLDWHWPQHVTIPV